MRLQAKLSILIFLVAFVMLCAMIVIISYFAESTTHEIENDMMEQSSSLIKFWMGEDAESLRSNVQDWAYWDPSYEFIKGENPGFVAENIPDSTFEGLRIKYVRFSHNNGTIVYERYYDIDIGEDVVPSERFSAELDAIVAALLDEDSVGGFAYIDGKPYFVGYSQIYDTAAQRRAEGYMVFMRQLSDQRIELVGSNLGEDMRLLPGTIPGEDGKDALFDPDGDIMVVYTQIEDITGAPAAYFKFNASRAFHDQYHVVLRKTIMFYALVSLFIGIVVFWLIKRNVLDPLRSVDETIAHIIETQDLTKEIPVRSNDEVGEVAGHFNEMARQLDTDRRLLREQNTRISDALERLQEIDQLKDEFLSNVSHELRTPLTCLKSYTQLLLSGKQGPLGKDQRESLTIILESTDALVTIVNDLLDLSHLERGKAQFHMRVHDLAELVKETEVEFVPLVEKIGGKITFDCEGPVMVSADEARIKQVVRNLIDNAVKYSVGRKPRIAVRVRSADGWARIAVSDNGVGIPEAEQDRIFTKFYRVSQGMTSKVGGSGLGLSIAKHIITAHNGRIGVESRVEEGSTFIVSLPLHKK